MPAWTSKKISPFAAFVTLLSVAAVIAAITIILATRRPAPERRGMLPFPESQLDYYRLDDVAGHLHLPNLDRHVDWPEHPDGGFELRTNNLGFREDAPTTLAKPPGTIRILVTGDSHTDGVVANSESFANRLEDLLNSADGDARFEVLNGGHGHYGPQNYLGILERFLELDLDHFVVVFYVGNDFLDAVAEAWVRGQVELPDRPEGYMDRLEKAQSLSSAAVSQSLNQVYLLHTFPKLEGLSLDITVDVFHTISQLCDERGIGLYTVLLPTKAEVEPETDHDTADAAVALGLEPRDLRLSRRLATRLETALEDLGIPVLDLYPAFDKSTDELFWKRDHHLDAAGHRLAAEVFFEKFGNELASRSSN